MTFCDDVITYDVTYLVSKDVFTNKEQLCQSFWQSVKEQKFKAKKIKGGGSIWPPLKASRVKEWHKWFEYDIDGVLELVTQMDCHVSEISFYWRTCFKT